MQFRFDENFDVTWKIREAFPVPVSFFVKVHKCFFDNFHERIQLVTLVCWCYLRQNQGKLIFFYI